VGFSDALLNLSIQLTGELQLIQRIELFARDAVPVETW
jgi:hypothetical protein